MNNLSINNINFKGTINIPSCKFEKKETHTYEQKKINTDHIRALESLDDRRTLIILKNKFASAEQIVVPASLNTVLNAYNATKDTDLIVTPKASWFGPY